jgi:hypothetical protein
VAGGGLGLVAQRSRRATRSDRGRSVARPPTLSDR